MHQHHIWLGAETAAVQCELAGLLQRPPTKLHFPLPTGIDNGVAQPRQEFGCRMYQQSMYWQ